MIIGKNVKFLGVRFGFAMGDDDSGSVDVDIG